MSSLEDVSYVMAKTKTTELVEDARVGSDLNSFDSNWLGVHTPLLPFHGHSGGTGKKF